MIKLAGEVVEGETLKFDRRILLALRDPQNPSSPIGPEWLVSAALDITALGSATVLGLTVVAVAGFLMLQGMWRTGVFVTIAPAAHCRQRRAQAIVPASSPRCRAAPARSDDHELSERPRAHVGGCLPDARRALDADRRAPADEVLLHGDGDARDGSRRREPGLPWRPLSDRRSCRLADWAVAGRFSAGSSNDDSSAGPG